GAEGQRRAERRQRQGRGPVQPGGRGDQDVPHGGQRGLPTEGGAVQGAARPAAEVGRRLLRQAGRPAGGGDRPGGAACAGGVELRAGRVDRQGREPGGCTESPPGRAGGAGGVGGGAGGRRRGGGGRRPEPDGGRPAAGDDGEDGRGGRDVPAF